MLKTSEVIAILKKATNQQLLAIFDATAPNVMHIQADKQIFVLICKEQRIKSKNNVANLFTIGQWEYLFNQHMRTNVSQLLYDILNGMR